MSGRVCKPRIYHYHPQQPATDRMLRALTCVPSYYECSAASVCTRLQTVGRWRRRYDNGKEYQGDHLHYDPAIYKSPTHRTKDCSGIIIIAALVDRLPWLDVKASATAPAVRTQLLTAQHLMRVPVARWSTDIPITRPCGCPVWCR